MPRRPYLDCTTGANRRMSYAITYQKDNEIHHLEWIVPTGWSTAAVCDSFAQQFPQAQLLAIHPWAGQ